jgi:hypothetical protein
LDVSLADRFRILNAKVKLGQGSPKDVEEGYRTGGLGLCDDT